MSEILRAIREGAVGAAIFSPAIAARMIDYFNRVEQRTPLFAFPQLTEPKTQALKLIA